MGAETSTLRELPARVTGIGIDRWPAVAKRIWERAREDRLPLVAAGVGFFFTIAVFPALIALLTVYGMAFDAQDVQQQVERVLGDVSSELRTIVVERLRSFVTSQSLSIGLFAGLAGLLWSTSSGIHNAMKAIVVAYDENERRGFVKMRAIAIGFTVAGLIVAGIVAFLLTVLPAVLRDSPLPDWLIGFLRWVLAALLLTGAASSLYRFATQERHGGYEWALKAAAGATVVWSLMTLVLSYYVQNVANFAETYGVLAGVIVLMLWMWLSALVFLVGALVAAEMHRESGDRDD